MLRAPALSRQMAPALLSRGRRARCDRHATASVPQQPPDRNGISSNPVRKQHGRSALLVRRDTVGLRRMVGGVRRDERGGTSAAEGRRWESRGRRALRSRCFLACVRSLNATRASPRGLRRLARDARRAADGERRLITTHASHGSAPRLAAAYDLPSRRAKAEAIRYLTLGFWLAALGAGTLRQGAACWTLGCDRVRSRSN